jgi:hypothetical protein
MSTKNNTIGAKVKFQNLPNVDANKKLTAPEFNQLVDFQNSPVQQIAGSLDDTDIIIDGTKNYGTTIVVTGATRTITANANGHLQGNNIKQRYQFNINCTLTLVGFDATGNNTGTITPIPAGTYDFKYIANRNGRNLEIDQNISNEVTNKLDKVTIANQSVASKVDFDQGVNIAENVGIGTDNADGIVGAKILDLFNGSLGTSQLVNEGNAGEAFVSLVSGQSSSNLPSIMFKPGLRFATATLKDATGFSEVMRIDGSGNVFINKTTGTQKLEVNGNVLADAIAAGVANIINTADFGGGVAIGSGVGGISTAPLDGLLVEGIFGLGLNNPTTQFEIQQLADSSAILIHGFDDKSTDTIAIGVNSNGVPIITGTKDIFFNPGVSLVDNSTFRFGGSNPNVKMRYDSTSDNFEMDHTDDIGTVFMIMEVPMNSDTLSIYKKLGVNTDTPLAQVDVNQSGASAAIPALKLTQADLSEEMIKFDATIGVGNPIEAIGAKSFTQTHFLKINVEVLGVKYMPIGDLA